jgi:Domain of unknown function (DUF929)
VVDWDRVQELRDKGWGWDRIAKDEDVGFHPEASVTEPGRALRALYHRQHRRAERKDEDEPERPKKADKDAEEHRWTFARVGMLLTPTVGIWAGLAYVAPSPVGILVPAVPWLALAAAAAAFILLFGLLRTPGRRWTPVLRSTLIGAVVLGLVVSGLIGLTGYLAFGCPYLPPSSALHPQPDGWASGSMTPWTQNGLPVFYFFGATWCPYCSASSWAMWKALTEFQTNFNGQISGIPGTSFYYSNPQDIDPSTPEVVLASASVTSPVVAFQVSEYDWTLTSGTAGTFPGTSNCVQQAYVSAYSGSSIPFVAINGQYVHGGASLIDPSTLSTWAVNGAPTVATDVLTETGTPWSIAQGQAAWICAFVLKSNGYSTVSAFIAANPGLDHANDYQWTSAMQTLVNGDLTQLG